jgi:hypothetical protein
MLSISFVAIDIVDEVEQNLVVVRRHEWIESDWDLEYKTSYSGNEKCSRECTWTGQE